MIKTITNSGFSVLLTLYVTTLIGWILLLNVPISQRSEFKEIRKSDRLSVLGGALGSFAGSLFHILALANTYTSYATAVRRLDAVISVALGWRYLKEKSIRLKLIGSIVMTLGSVIMLLS